VIIGGNMLIYEGIKNMFCPLTGLSCMNAKNIHVSESINGVPSQNYICDQCASTNLNNKKELPQISPSQFTHFTNIINEMEARHNEEVVMQTPCPNCGMALSEFVKSGRIGCPECYEFFKAELKPIIGMAQENNTQHNTGKKPKQRKESFKNITSNINSLQKKMDIAIKEEKYEDAVKLRDQINALKVKIEGS
jgi:protein arginine kinase activator